MSFVVFFLTSYLNLSYITNITTKHYDKYSCLCAFSPFSLHLTTQYCVCLIIFKTLCSTAVDGFMGTSRQKWRFPTTQIQIKMSWFPVSLTLILAQAFFFFFFFTKRLECCQKGPFSSLCHLHIPISRETRADNKQCSDVKLAVLFKSQQMDKN